MKGKIDKPTVVTRDFYSTVSIFDFLKSRHKVSMSIDHLNNIILSKNLTNWYL